MDLYRSLTEEASRLPLASFVQRHNRLYVCGDLPDSGLVLGFSTHVSGPTVAFPRSSAPRGSARFVYLVAKSDRNDWKTRISVGRAANNDIVLKHESVSKLHAAFLVRLRREGLKKVEEMILVDTGSSNGTFHRGRLLSGEAAASQPLSIGDKLRFGEVQCEFLDASGLYQRLRARMRTDF